jgi:glycosyltransferase involved in cell wall biosynthesis
MRQAPKILLISHNFPPTAGPESSLVRLNAEFLHRQGMQVRVLTTTRAHTTQGTDLTLLEGLSTQIIVDRVASPEAVLTQKFPLIGRLAAVGAGRFVLPEIYLPWVFPATSRGKKIIKEWHPNVLYSRATKHVSNVVGWRLKRATGLPWVAHFSDPWISAGLPYRPLQRLIGLYYERRILRDADALVFVAPQAAQRVLKAYPQQWHDRVQIIPHGYEPLSLELSQVRPPARTSRPLRLIHAGAFYPTMRTPDTLIEALRRLQQRQPLAGRLEILCVGVDTTCYQPQVTAAGVQDVLLLRTNVSYDECQRLVAASDMTLIIDSPGYGGVFLPTKLIEAFAFDHPVLGLSERNGAVADVLHQTQLHWADLNDPDDIAMRLETLLQHWEAGDWGLTSAQRMSMDRFQIDRVNLPLGRIIQNLASNRKTFSP